MADSPQENRKQAKIDLKIDKYLLIAAIKPIDYINTIISRALTNFDFVGDYRDLTITLKIAPKEN